MAAMASGGEQDPNRRRVRTPSLANLLHPSSSAASDHNAAAAAAAQSNSLLSLSIAAAQLASAPDVSSSTASRRRRAAAEAYARSHALPSSLARAAAAASGPAPGSPRTPDAPTLDDRRRVARLSRTSSLASPALGVSRGSVKRLSRTKSAFAGRVARAAATAAAAADISASDCNSRSALPRDDSSEEGRTAAVPPPHLRTPQRPPPPPSALPTPLGASPGPSPTVLRPLSANPLGGYASKHTSASNSIESCVPSDAKLRTSSPLLSGLRGPRKDLFHAAAHRYSSVDLGVSVLARGADVARGVGAGPAGDAMDVDAEREPSSSSHDAKLISRPSRSRTTPDAKRAQNRESAKRFRVAQKKRWAELQESCDQKDKEIARLKGMLQEVTNRNLAAASSGGNTSSDIDKGIVSLVEQTPDALTIAELGLFVKLMGCKKEGHGDSAASSSKSLSHIQPPIAANVGSLYRVIVAKLDGSVLGIRHQNDSCGTVMGGEVGGCIWEFVHTADSAHLRFTVVHAAQMASVLKGEPTVFSYRRREQVKVKQEEGDESEKYMRMKGCLYPLGDENGEVKSVLLAEFVEL